MEHNPTSSSSSSDDVEQPPRLLHQRVMRVQMAMGRITRCCQCFYDHNITRYTNMICQECPERPRLCSTICFERYHQRMHPELYPSILPIITPTVLRRREGQYRVPPRVQSVIDHGAEGRPSPSLHQRTILRRSRDDPAPRLFLLRRSRDNQDHRRSHPCSRCAQCLYENRRKFTRLICCKCPERPALCSPRCFDHYHQRMHPQMYQTRQPRRTLSAAIRIREGIGSTRVQQTPPTPEAGPQRRRAAPQQDSSDDERPSSSRRRVEASEPHPGPSGYIRWARGMYPSSSDSSENQIFFVDLYICL